MPWNSLLLLPLLAGFLFLDWCFYTRFRWQRIEGNRLLLESVFCGIAFTILAAGIVVLAQTTQQGTDIGKWWIENMPPQLAGVSAAICITSLGLSLFLVAIINTTLWAFETVQGAAILAAEAAGDYMASVCYQADPRKDPIVVQLSNRVVYRGFVKTSPNLKPESQLALIVAGVGFLDKDTLALKWVNDFSSVWQRDANGDYSEAEVSSYIAIIPVRMVDNIHIFNAELDH